MAILRFVEMQLSHQKQKTKTDGVIITMAKKIDIGSKIFSTQSSALKRFREILHSYNDGDRIDNPEHHADLVGLIERYDIVLEDAGETLKGKGQIAYFERRRNTGTVWSTPSFWIVREDGEETDFSYKAAVKGESRGRVGDFYNACHEAVALELVLFKKRVFKEGADGDGRVACEKTGKLVTFEDASLYREQPYFRQIVKEFRAAKGWSEEIPDGVVTEPADRQTTTTFVDKAIAEEFKIYHNDRAVLRIVSK